MHQLNSCLVSVCVFWEGRQNNSILFFLFVQETVQISCISILGLAYDAAQLMRCDTFVGLSVLSTSHDSR